jgi:hypothetical protein
MNNPLFKTKTSSKQQFFKNSFPVKNSKNIEELALRFLNYGQYLVYI